MNENKKDQKSIDTAPHRASDRPVVTIPLDDYLLLKERLRSLDVFIDDIKIKLQKLEGNENFKEVLSMWLEQLKVF